MKVCFTIFSNEILQCYFYSQDILMVRAWGKWFRGHLQESEQGDYLQCNQELYFFSYMRMHMTCASRNLWSSLTFGGVQNPLRIKWKVWLSLQKYSWMKQLFCIKFQSMGPLMPVSSTPFPDTHYFFFLILVLSNKYKLITTHDFNIFLQYT